MLKAAVAVTLVVLSVLSVALAASLSTDTGVISARQNAPGTVQEPVALGFVEKLSAGPVPTASANADPLTDIKVTLPRVRFNARGFPVCTIATITAAGTDSGCPPGALLASGPVRSALWSPAEPTQAGTPCGPILDVWNAGSGKVVDFLQIPAGHTCADLQPGSVPPWTGTLRESGTTLVYDTPLPPSVSTDVGGLGLFFSLERETITFRRLSAEVGDRSVPFFASVGCVSGRRPYTVSFTATDGTEKQTTTDSGSGSC
jgi:hypothetical protein